MDLLYDLTIRLTEWRVGAEAKNRFCVLNAELTSAHRRLEDTANALAADLRRYFALRARRSPKRRPSFDASETSRSVISPFALSPVLTSISDIQPRPRRGRCPFRISRRPAMARVSRRAHHPSTTRLPRRVFRCPRYYQMGSRLASPLPCCGP